MDKPAIPWREIFAILLRRRSLILTVFVIGVTGVAALTWLRGPSYVAAAKIMVTSERAQMTVSPDADAKPVIDRVTEQDLNSEVALLQSTSLVREVLEHYRGQLEAPDSGVGHYLSAALRFPLELPGILYRHTHGVPPLTPFESWVQSTASRVRVDTISKSNLIEVSFQSSTAKWASQFVNDLVNRHVERHAQFNKQSDARRFYEGQQRLLNTKMQDAEKELGDFYTREGFDSAPEQQAALRARLAQMETTRSTSATALAEAKARMDFLSNAIRQYPKSIPADSKLAGNEGIQLIKARILALELDRSQALSAYAPTSVKIKQFDRQLEEAKRLLEKEKANASVSPGAANPTYQSLEMDLAQTGAQKASMEARLTDLSSQIDAVRRKLEHLESIGSEQERLEQRVASAKTSYLTYLKKEEEARFADALDDSKIVNVVVVEPASEPVAPRPARAMTTLALGALLSLMAGVALAFLRDWLDPTVKSAVEAAALAELPVLADIPS